MKGVNRMNVICIDGSPKGKNSNTAIMLGSIMEPFMRESCITLTLGDLNINHCTGCYSCWTKTPGICIINDDMKSSLEIIRTADFLIFGSPLYFNNISGTLKSFVDRLTALGGNPHQTKTENRQKVKIIMMSNCGFPVREQFDVVSLWIKHFTNMLNGELVAEFYTTCGKMLTSENAADQEKANKYKEYLRLCGKSIYENGALTQELLEQNAINVNEY